MPRPPSASPRLTAWLLLFAASLACAPRASAATWAELFAIEPVRYTFLETEEGRALAKRILGRVPTSDADLAELRAELEVGGPFHDSVRERIEELERRFEESGGSTKDVGPLEQSFLRDLSKDLLTATPGTSQIQFAPLPDPDSYAGTRGAFLSGAAANPYVAGYEATRVLSLRPTRALSEFEAQTGIRVTARDAQGQPTEAVIRVLSDNPGNRIQIVGDFNGWSARPEDELKPVPGTPYFEARVSGLKHGMQYRLVLNGRQVLDPAAALYTPEDHLNSVFWDFGRPGAYKMKTRGVDLRGRHIMLGETEVRALAEKWPNPTGGTGPARRSDTYRFIATSGVINQLKGMGYNAIEFLPFNASNDAESWRFRYQVYGLFAPDARFGTPDEFAMMIDAFNKADVAVVADVVVGHYPFEGNSGQRALGEVGLHRWYKPDGRLLFGGDLSPWGTYRYDYANPGVRRHLIDSILTLVSRYGVSGLRFDNLDGIRFCAGGNDFLRELHQELRAYRPEVWTNAEMFFGDNSVTAALDQGGLGLNARTNSDLFDWFKERARGGTDGFDMADLRRRLRDPIGSWHEGARVDYITSHDEAANGRGGFTGEYPATLLDGGGDWWVQRKSEVFEGIVMTSGSATMDMPQVRLLQKGNFSSNPAIDWSLRANPVSAQTNRFLGDLSRYVSQNRAFAFGNMSPSIENHTDYANHLISLVRTDGGKKVYVLINLSHESFDNYAFGVDARRELKLVLDNDDARYGGSGRLEARLPGRALPVSATGMHGKSGSVTVPFVPPMSVLVLEGL
jgi:1,4-alpha-glucan branching enzyme